MRFFVLLLFFGILSCRTVNPKFDIEPTCLQDIVEKIMAEPPSKVPVEIKQGYFEDKEIFVITQKRGTQEISIILSSDCEYVCEIGGEIQTTNCPEGISNSIKDLHLIWMDNR